jgi:large subunit ribosomal protein L4
LARKSAFSIKAKESNIIVLEDFNLNAKHQKSSLTVLKALELENKVSVCVGQ